jgi:hypothetical protein
MLTIFAESESCSSDSSEEEKNSRLAFPDHTEKRLQVGHRLAFPDHTEKRLHLAKNTRISGKHREEASGRSDLSLL